MLGQESIIERIQYPKSEKKLPTVLSMDGWRQASRTITSSRWTVPEVWFRGGVTGVRVEDEFVCFFPVGIGFLGTIGTAMPIDSEDTAYWRTKTGNGRCHQDLLLL